ETVYEEKNRANDDLERRVSEKFNEYIYGEHPYSTQTVLGSVAHLKNPSLSKMYQYFEDYYVANNMALVLCGNFKAEDAKPLIANSFGKLASGSVPEFPEYPKSTFQGREVEKVRITPIKAGFMGYKLVPEGHPDRPALEIVGSMISNENQTGFMDLMTLNNEVLYAGGYQEFMKEDGSAFIFFVPKIFGKSLKRFENQIRASFADISSGNFSDEYFEAIKNNIYKSYALTSENLSNRGWYIGYSFSNGMEVEQILSFPEEVRKVSKETVMETAAKYYGENFFVMQSHTGFPKKVKLDKPPYKPIDSRTDASSAYARKFEGIQTATPAPTFVELGQDVQIANDYFFHTYNPNNDIFTLRLKIAKGITHDGSYPLLAAAVEAAGTSSYSRSALKEKFASLGASYSIAADYNSFDITVTGLDDRFEETLKLTEHLLTAFAPTPNTIKFLYNQRSTENRLAKNNPSTGGRALYLYGLFDNQSSYMSRPPAREIKKLDPAILQSKLQDLLKDGFSSIHYVGQKDQDDILELISTNQFYKRNKVDAYEFLESRDVSETTIFLINDKKAIQSYVYYIVKGPVLNTDELVAKEALNDYFTNGLSGLLFQEVREFRSLAYAV
ncbi:MAG: insulinase family protein, partial [Bacteroidota bacterium]